MSIFYVNVFSFDSLQWKLCLVVRDVMHAFLHPKRNLDCLSYRLELFQALEVQRLSFDTSSMPSNILNCVLYIYSGTQRLPRLIGIKKAVEIMLVSLTFLNKPYKKSAWLFLFFHPSTIISISQIWWAYADLSKWKWRFSDQHLTFLHMYFLLVCLSSWCSYSVLVKMGWL